MCQVTLTCRRHVRRWIVIVCGTSGSEVKSRQRLSVHSMHSRSEVVHVSLSNWIQLFSLCRCVFSCAVFSIMFCILLFWFAKWFALAQLSSAYYLFKDTLQGAATGCTTFPMKFCQHRWLENVTVCQRLLAIWPHLVNYVKSVAGGKCPDPKTTVDGIWLFVEVSNL